MSAIVRQIAFLLLSICGLYALIWAATAWFFPEPSSTGGLNSARAPSTVYMTEPKYVFMARSSLSAAKPRAIFLGASNTVVGFNQEIIARLLPDLEIDNLGVGGANIAEIAQVVDLVQEVQPPAARAQTTYVLSIWYGEFFENKTKWFSAERHPGDTDIDIERYRYSFYRRTAQGAKALLPATYLAAEVQLVRPFLVLDRVSRSVTQGLRAFVHGKHGDGEKPQADVIAERNSAVVTPAQRIEDLDYWKTQMLDRTEIAPEEVGVLTDLIGRILASGSKVLLVDLPIPRWHKTSSPIYPSYVGVRDHVVEQFQGRPGFSFFEMGGEDDEADFSDEVHPKPRVTPQWAASVVAPLQQLTKP